MVMMLMLMLSSKGVENERKSGLIVIFLSLVVADLSFTTFMYINPHHAVQSNDNSKQN